ncbi:MAG: hypothetical protein H7A44_12025 [Opitutaceae bacterium]|nr:hypothetical protein [Opitutaceae bacterium]
MTEPVPYPENRLRDTAVAERPQERLERDGAGALSDTELLAMLLRSGTRGMDVLSLAGRLVNDAGSLAGLPPSGAERTAATKVLAGSYALQLVTAMECRQRVLRQQQGESFFCSPKRRGAVVGYLAC